MGMAAILVSDQRYVDEFSLTCTYNLAFKILLKMAQWFLRKASFSYVNDLGPRSRNDLDLQYSHIFIKSISYLHLPGFRSTAAIVAEKFTVFTFSYRKA